MCSRVRLWGLGFVIALLITVLVPFAPQVSRGAQSSFLIITSPPPGLGLPVGQHVGVRYRFMGDTRIVLRLEVDGVVVCSDDVEPGQEVTHAWAPAEPRSYQVRVYAVSPAGSVLASASLAVFGLPVGSRARIP